MDTFKIYNGKPLPFGVTLAQDKVNFALFCPDANELTLYLFHADMVPLGKIQLDPLYHRTGDVWHIEVNNLPMPFYYAYHVGGNETLSEGKEKRLLLDPYATSTSSDVRWGGQHNFLGVIDQKCTFDWEDDASLNIPLNELIIYEMHVRAFTFHASSQVAHPGTFVGMIEKIPHLVDLGINAVELLPIQEFDENECHLHNPINNQLLYNFWGYASLNFFALTNRYASKNAPSAAIQEFKRLVKELHKHGIEVILDVVFNHSGEGNEKGPTYSFKGLANSTYYLFNEKEGYLNYSGCGNTFNCNHPIVTQMILDCLRYWVVEMHVDGFRFDLASIFKRGLSGEPLPSSPLIAAISLDPILAKTKLIAEPWDAAGFYDLGGFYPQTDRWSEWNGRYRDTVRRFIKGSPGVKAEFATSLCGSQDIFHGRSPLCSLNFVVCHDGFTLADLVSYNQKHNLNNGEQNRDGNSFNDSWNCGIEGPSNDPKILTLRARQMRNFHVALMLSQGIPMLHMGDEYGHTKKGNNNTWCQNNELSGFLWNQLFSDSSLNANGEFYRFYRLMIAFRKQNPLLKHSTFLTDEDVEWHGSQPKTPAWNANDSLLALTLKSRDSKETIYAAFNAHDYAREVCLPESPSAAPWLWVVDTASPSPLDFNEHPESRPVTSKKLTMPPHSAIVLIADAKKNQ